MSKSQLYLRIIDMKVFEHNGTYIWNNFDQQLIGNWFYFKVKSREENYITIYGDIILVQSEMVELPDYFAATISNMQYEPYPAVEIKNIKFLSC